MAATNLQGNWGAVSFNSVTFTKVQECKFSLGGSLSYYAGDLDRFNTVSTNFMTIPTATVTSGNPAQFMAIASGTSSTFTATHKDAKLASGGDILYVLANAIFETANTGGPHASYGSGDASFGCVSADGTTNPFSFTRA